MTEEELVSDEGAHFLREETTKWLAVCQGNLEPANPGHLSID